MPFIGHGPPRKPLQGLQARVRTARNGVFTYKTKGVGQYRGARGLSSRLMLSPLGGWSSNAPNATVSREGPFLNFWI